MTTSEELLFNSPQNAGMDYEQLKEAATEFRDKRITEAATDEERNIITAAYLEWWLHWKFAKKGGEPCKPFDEDYLRQWEEEQHQIAEEERLAQMPTAGARGVFEKILAELADADAGTRNGKTFKAAIWGRKAGFECDDVESMIIDAYDKAADQYGCQKGDRNSYVSMIEYTVNKVFDLPEEDMNERISPKIRRITHEEKENLKVWCQQYIGPRFQLPETTPEGDGLAALTKNLMGSAGCIWVGHDDNYAGQFAHPGGIDCDSFDLVSLFTYGDKISQRTNRTFKGAENTLEMYAVCIEIDDPMDDTGMDKDDLKERRRRNLSDTMILLGSLGARPTTITFSGGKSFHVAFRLSKPISSERLVENEWRLSSALARIGADPQMASPARSMRMPHRRLDNGGPREKQNVLYIDGEAEISFDDLLQKMETLGDAIHGKVVMEASDVGKQAASTPAKEGEADGKDKYICPVMKVVRKVRTQEKEENGKRKFEVRTEWIAHDACMNAFLCQCGIYRASPEDRRMYGKDIIAIVGNGIFERLDIPEAFQRLADNIYEHMGEEYAAMWGKMFGTTMCGKNLARYQPELDAPPTRDTADTVYLPFKNGVLVITKGGHELRPYDGFLFDANSPTLKHEWKASREKSEMEIFLEHACGSKEGSPKWKKRKHSIMTMLGYLISQYRKRSEGHLCILIDETEMEDNGRTGKGIIMSSVQYLRPRFLINMKKYNKDSQRFWLAGLTADKDYIQLDDLQKGFDCSDLFTYLTEDLTIERKGQNEVHIIPYALSPKWVAGSNSAPKGTSASYTQRIRIFELANHYNAKLTAADEFGHQLYDDWDEEEWQRFYSFMVQCVQLYLREGLVQCAGDNIEQKRLEASIPAEILEYFDHWSAPGHHAPTFWYPTFLLVQYFYSWYNDQYGRRCQKDYGQKYLVRKLREYADLTGKVLLKGPHDYCSQHNVQCVRLVSKEEAEERA